MKLLYKGAIGTLALAAAGLTVWTAAAHRQDAPPPERTGTTDPAPLASAPVTPANAAANAGDANTAAPDEAQSTTEPAVLPLPNDLKISLKGTPADPIVKVQRQGYLVAVGFNRQPAVGVHSAEWVPKSGFGAANLVWETTNLETMETQRGTLQWHWRDGVTVHPSMRPLDTVASGSAPSHDCRAHDAGKGQFTVVCRVDGSAAAASLGTRDPKNGVWSMVGDKTFVRFEVGVEDGLMADTKVIGYEKGGRGTIVRVEASRVEGETETLLAINSDSRAQPQPIRRIGCICRLPASPDLL